MSIVKAVKISVLFIMLGFFLVSVYTFNLAYNDPCKCVLIHINRAGEANTELFTFIILTPVSIISVFYIAKGVLAQSGPAEPTRTKPDL